MQSRNVMIFILVMAMSGLADLIAELVPSLGLGPIELGISTFWFVPLTLCILFPGWWSALAAPVGELVFSDLILGEFGGLGEFEEVVLVTIALYIAGRIVKDPKNVKQLVIAGLLVYAIAEFPAKCIDVAKIWIGVEEFEAVQGLPQSVIALEFIDFSVEYIITGLLFGLLPMLKLVPALHGKIEPLMGMRPRSAEDASATTLPWSWIMVTGLIGFIAALAIAVVSAMGFDFVVFEPEYLETFGTWFIWIAISCAVFVALLVMFLPKRNIQKS